MIRPKEKKKKKKKKKSCSLIPKTTLAQILASQFGSERIYFYFYFLQGKGVFLFDNIDEKGLRLLASCFMLLASCFLLLASCFLLAISSTSHSLLPSPHHPSSRARVPSFSDTSQTQVILAILRKDHPRIIPVKFG